MAGAVAGGGGAVIELGGGGFELGGAGAGETEEAVEKKSTTYSMPVPILLKTGAGEHFRKKSIT